MNQLFKPFPLIQFIAILVFLFIIQTVKAQNQAVTFNSKFTSEELKSAPVKLIPYPQHVVWKHQTVILKNMALISSGGVSEDVKDELTELLTTCSIELNQNSNVVIRFLEDKKLPSEAYILDLTKTQITITAAGENGYFYGLQTLRQLLVKTTKGCQLELCRIEDEPTFPIRGYMIDVGRNFQPMDLLKKQIDILARYKMNTFHWHLTDRPAWRIDSKVYPQLIVAENHRPTRDPGKYYSYDDIRELIAYARKKKITVIPEIDMPGHSNSFTKAMGFKMETARGMKALEAILLEFFSEIPKEMAPMIHIGSDEIHIPNPEEFISKMVEIVEGNGRVALVWSPGLNAKKTVIRQTWGGGERTKESGMLEIDSRKSYINAGEPMSIINTLFLRPIGFGSANSVLGGIICFWPDVNLDRAEDAFKQNPVYPSLLTYAWQTWTAGIHSISEDYFLKLPPQNTEAFDYFSAFEEYLLAHKKRYFKNEPFSYKKQVDKHWRVIGPFNKSEGDLVVLTEDKDSYLYNGSKISWKPASGNTLVIRQRWMRGGYFPDAKKNQTVYALTYIHSTKKQKIQAWVNFETALRANRVYAGIPKNGEWDNYGGEIYLNDKKLPGPNWKNPGWQTVRRTGWGNAKEQEIPWADEELYWTRRPAEFSLKKGWNKLLVKIPCETESQNWMFTFVPLDMTGLRFAGQPDEN